MGFSSWGQAVAVVFGRSLVATGTLSRPRPADIFAFPLRGSVTGPSPRLSPSTRPAPFVWHSLPWRVMSAVVFSGDAPRLPPARRSSPLRHIIAPAVTVPFRSDDAGTKEDAALSFQTTMHDAALCRRCCLCPSICSVAGSVSAKYRMRPSQRTRLQQGGGSSTMRHSTRLCMNNCLLRREGFLELLSKKRSTLPCAHTRPQHRLARRIGGGKLSNPCCARSFLFSTGSLTSLLAPQNNGNTRAILPCTSLLLERLQPRSSLPPALPNPPYSFGWRRCLSDADGSESRLRKRNVTHSIDRSASFFFIAHLLSSLATVVFPSR